MKKLASLREYLVAGAQFNPERLESWVEDIQLKLRGKDEGNRVLFHEMTYRAVFSVEGYPYAVHSIEIFSARLMAWLADHDERSELDNSDPDISVDVLDDETADIELTLTFKELVYLTPADNGPIEFKGRQWALEDAAHDIAQTAEVSEATENG